MRFEDITDLWRLWPLTRNAVQIVRFRRRQRSGDELSVALRDGRRLFLRGGTQDLSIFRRVFVHDEYRVAAFATGLSCVLDLGAHVGIFAALVAPLAERVIAYEPVPENFCRLERNVASSRNVEAIRAGVDARDGVLTLFGPRTPRGSARFSKHEVARGAPRIEVPCVSLDTLFARHDVDRCDLLKLDVEGAEHDILEQASAGTLARIRRIHGEYHPFGRESGGDRLEALLTGHDFLVERVPKRKRAGQGLFFARRPD